MASPEQLKSMTQGIPMAQIVTWNVNSIRTRLDQVLQWLQAQAASGSPIDLLCLQETKVSDEQFPLAPFEDAGYQVAIFGQKSYNGVALISREPLQEVSLGFAPVLEDGVGDLDDQKRLIRGSLNGITIVNVYVPNGSEVGSDKYSYKLRWLLGLQHYLSALLQEDPSLKLVLSGDYNIAPSDEDIYDAKKAGQIMASDLERQALTQIAALGLQDAFRKINPDPGHYSWWDYRSGGFPRNRGWRIDHHFVSSALYPSVQDCQIDVEPRGAEQPSDHAPVILTVEG